MHTLTEPMTLRAGIKKTIHVVGANVRLAKKQTTGPYPPCYTVHCVDGVFHCRGFEAAVRGGQHFERPLANGAVVTLTTRGKVVLLP